MSDRVLNQIPEVIPTGLKILVLVKAGTGRRQQKADGLETISLLQCQRARLDQIRAAMQRAVVSA